MVEESEGARGKEEEKVKLPIHVRALYYVVLFFAYWFGAARFDYDGDGDFDPEDVEQYLEDHGIVKRNLMRKKGVKKAATGAVSSPKAQQQPQQPQQPSPAAEVVGSSTHASDKPRGSILDRDGDGDVDFNDLIETKVDGEAEEDLAMHNLATGQIVPLFILFECAVVFLFWVIFAAIKASEDGADFLTVKAGLDSISDTGLDLRYYGPACEDLRPQAYRWLTYQFTHVGIMHVSMNVLLNIFLGIPLEGVHGHFRMFIMFNAGVLGGAFCNMVADGHTPVVGCSGGCYALIGIHIADLIMNWSQKKFRIPTLVFIIFLVTVDFLFNFLSTEQSNTSHSAHLGGSVAGVAVGIAVVRNLRVSRFERFIIDAAILFALFWTIFSMAWLFSQTEGPRSIWEAMADEPGWCWYRAFLDFDLKPLEWRCVRCGTEDCVEWWTKFNVTMSQTLTAENNNVPVSALSRYSFAQCTQMGWHNETY